MVGNAASNNNNGLRLLYSDYNELRENTANKNSATGIALITSIHNTLVRNSVTYNYRGFELATNSNYNTLVNNTVAHNSGFGISVSSCTNNKIYLNTFELNSQNANDGGGSNNAWDDSVSLGNYWDDYSGSGVYAIPGSSNSVDHYPIFVDSLPPTIDSPDDVTYAEGTTNHWVTWTPTDAHP
ncbi:MAG: right-handed parallel beta-helix repeat-containing protein [Candidatus Thorarchaeota archaeon]|nr:right-handed parallel beta-helix repeat-containing protein [Candidatus Thorarchaeota archaeon]